MIPSTVTIDRDSFPLWAEQHRKTGTVDDIFYRPRMPYTLGLLGSLPRFARAQQLPFDPKPAGWRSIGRSWK